MHSPQEIIDDAEFFAKEKVVLHEHNVVGTISVLFPQIVHDFHLLPIGSECKPNQIYFTTAILL